MADRKAELERKRAKLTALREEKERKKKEKEEQERRLKVNDISELKYGFMREMSDVDYLLVQVESGGGDTGSLPVSDASSIDVDEYLKSLGLQPQSDDKSLPPTGDLGGHTSSPLSKAEDLQRRVERLTMSQVTQTNIPAQEILSYAKETQTAQSGPDHRDSHAFDYYDEYNLNPGLEWDDEFAVLTFDDGQEEDSSLSMDHHRLSKLPPGILRHGMPEVMEVAPALTESEKKVTAEEVHKPTPELSEEEKMAISMSPQFQSFVVRAARIMERAIYEPSTDIFVDYAKSADADDEKEKSATKLCLNRVFYDEKWSKNRCVTCLDWSSQYPELLAASYSNNPDAPNEPDGVCLIWNTKFTKSTPEFIFHCQSPVTSTTFAKFHPNLVLGGTYSGSIVLWDNRVEKRTPVQRSPLSTSAHTQPVYCLKVVGSQNSHNVISISTDGKLCSWSLDMLSQPQETIDLSLRQGKSVAATCLTFPANGINNFVVGSEDGTVYTGCRHGTKTGLLEAFDAHHAPVTGISSHCVPGPMNFSDWYLTSSFDWSLKLWNLKEPKPIYSFDGNGDYIYDVAWSPIHPAVFASVDGEGKLDLWNLNSDTELPVASVMVDDGGVALNRVSWTQSGLLVTAGDDMGKIWVYDVGEQLVNPRGDDWQKFSRTLTELKNNQRNDDI